MKSKIIQRLLMYALFVFSNGNYMYAKGVLLPKLQEEPQVLPAKKNVWVFVMAGQSNMAGRGDVEAMDTLSNDRILTINSDNNIVIAKEPLHFYEPRMTGLDCGMSFGKSLLRHILDSVSILIVPTAVGGSSIKQWLSDKPHRGVKLFSNFQEKVRLAKQFGEVKAVLWHQGESDANPKGIESRFNDLTTLFAKFRTDIGDSSLPVMVGELGRYSNTPEYWKEMNKSIIRYAKWDANCITIRTSDLKDRGDKVHFNSKGQRKMGKRFAKAYLKSFAD